MKNVFTQKLVKQVTIWLLAIIIVLFFLTGFGITEYRVVESITFGLLSKNLAFKIHAQLWIPFLIFLALHVLQRMVKRKTASR